MKRVLLLLAVIGFAVQSAAAAQSLADVARKEQARRKTVKKTAPVYTNKDVRPSSGPAEAPPPAGAATASTAQGAAPAAEGEPPAAGQETTEGAEGSGPKGSGAEGAGAAGGEPGEASRTDEEQRADDEARWRERMREARAALERNQMFEQALESRINALWADFTARDDPAQRAAIDAERKKAIAQRDRVKAEIVAQTKAIADIEEEARRAGVPPGWLR
jgi:hypothetical protein